MSISQTRSLPPARTTFFPYLFLPPTQSTCRSLWNEESVSERGVRIRKGSSDLYGESESERRVRVLNKEQIRSFQRIRSFWSDLGPVVPFEDPDLRIRSGVNDLSLLLVLSAATIHQVAGSISILVILYSCQHRRIKFHWH
ncbi:hypothetical protein AVEN_186461-1 [Araneus ventricosus]|uniref:Uncharacterized protein n=1 Tax=Araneus ventricosus TaxID=182803 RepID=A0A4Y2S3G8_ARAVE|nr:hypothetical protein AVEN_186461-1 [Araneus ventricosus]